MTLENPQTPTVECFRCGYDLRGIADTQPCPECGLLAQRSRRATDELHQTRPKWLASISWGVNLILLSIVVAGTWPFLLQILARPLSNYVWQNHPQMDPAIWAACIVFFGFDLAVILLPLGAFLLTRPEGYEPADRLDRRRRIALRATAMIPIGAIILAAYNMHSNPYFAYFYVYGIGVIPDPGWQSADFLAIGMVPPALLLFFHLRAIAKRARSAHLAEHCAIVARGTAATLLFLAAVIVLIEQGDDWFGNNWIYRSRTIMVVLLILSVFGCLFILWSLYLLVRFAISFRRAAQQAKQQWRRDDRALEPP